MRKYQSKFLLFMILPLLISGALLLSVIIRYGVNVPYFDDYHMLPVFQAIGNHHLPLAQLWTQDNENREVFPKILMAATAYATHWNVKIQMFVNFTMSLIIAGLLYKFIGLTIKNSMLRISAAALMVFWLFSSTQAENWLWGWEAVWYMCIAATLGTIYFISRLGNSRQQKFSKHYAFWGAVSSAIVASFSLASGLLIWPIGLIMLLLQKQSRKTCFRWFAAGLITSSLYLVHYTHPARSPSLTIFLHQPMNFVKFLLALMGRPISDQMNGAMSFGAIFLLLAIPAIYCAWYHRKKINRLLPWLSIATFSFSALLVTDIARVGGGLGNSLSSRYTTLAILYIVSLLGIFISMIDSLELNVKLSKLLGLVILAFCLPLLAASYGNGLYASKLRHSQMVQIENCTKQPVPSSNCLSSANYNLDTSTSLKQLNYLKAKGWGSY